MGFNIFESEMKFFKNGLCGFPELYEWILMQVSHQTIFGGRSSRIKNDFMCANMLII